MNIRLKKTLRGVALAIAAGTAAFAGTLAYAAGAFPTKPIRILVTGGAGANLDVATRAVAEQMSRNLGEPVIVENVAGAGGLIALRQIAKRTPADGYTLLTTANTVVLAAAFSKEPGYDPVTDLTGIGDMQQVPYLLVGPASQPSKTLAELIAEAKAKPGELSMANGGVGTSTHLPALLFAQQAGIQLSHISYRGNGPALPDLIGGRLNLLFDAGITAGPMIAAGKLRAFGVSTAKRVAAFPNIPTLAEQGLTNFDFKGYLGMYAPAGTPKDVVKRLHEALRVATSSDAVRDQFRSGGAEAGTTTPEEWNEFIKQDMARAAKVVKDLGIEKQ